MDSWTVETVWFQMIIIVRMLIIIMMITGGVDNNVNDHVMAARVFHPEINHPNETHEPTKFG